MPDQPDLDDEERLLSDSTTLGLPALMLHTRRSGRPSDREQTEDDA